MLRLYKRALLLIIILSAAIFTARLIGKAQPAPSLFAVIFTNPDGSPCEMPCMFGVRPGKMTVSEVVKALRSHPATRTMTETQSGKGIYEFDATGVSLEYFSESNRLDLDAI